MDTFTVIALLAAVCSVLAGLAEVERRAREIAEHGEGGPNVSPPLDNPQLPSADLG